MTLSTAPNTASAWSAPATACSLGVIVAASVNFDLRQDRTGQHHELVKANAAAAAVVAAAAAGALLASAELTWTHTGQHQDEFRINHTLQFRCIEIS